MKKLWALILAGVLTLSLSSCGGNSGSLENMAAAIDKNAPESYIGIWESANMRFTISKGGTGRYEQPNSDTGFFDFTYEIRDEVLTMYLSGAVQNYTASFELSDDGTTLTILHNGLPGYYEGETQFTKTAAK